MQKEKTKAEEVQDLLVSLQTIPVDDEDDEPFVVQHVDSSFEGPNATKERLDDIEVDGIKSPESLENVKPPRKITELDLNQAFTIGDVQPDSSEHVEQTEVCTFVEEIKTIEHAEPIEPPAQASVRKQSTLSGIQRSDRDIPVPMVMSQREASLESIKGSYRN